MGRRKCSCSATRARACSVSPPGLSTPGRRSLCASVLVPGAEPLLRRCHRMRHARVVTAVWATHSSTALLLATQWPTQLQASGGRTSNASPGRAARKVQNRPAQLAIRATNAARSMVAASACCLARHPRIVSDPSGCVRRRGVRSSRASSMRIARLTPIAMERCASKARDPEGRLPEKHERKPSQPGGEAKGVGQRRR
jgi:hypothetical protein